MEKGFLIKRIEESQDSYRKAKEKQYIKKYSQFFTSADIALKMVETINVKHFSNLKSIKILEPSAGCGMLIYAVVELIVEKTSIKTIFIDAYEIDTELSEILKINTDFMRIYFESKYNIRLKIKIRNSDFILEYIQNEQSFKSYNIIISNPPFKKIKHNSIEALFYKKLVFGQPNIYILFIAQSLKLLKNNGIYVLISPRNYLIGDYSKKLRHYIFNNFSLIHIHSFDRRNIFKDVNQEIVISTYARKKGNDKITVSYNGKFSLYTDINKIIYSNEKMSFFIPKSSNDLELLMNFACFKNTLNDLHLKLSVGPVVQFRSQKFIVENALGGDYVPLLISCDIQKDNKIIYYERENNLSRKTHNKSISKECNKLVKNKRYVILRKILALDDKTTIIPAVLEDDYFNSSFIGLDNNLLYLHSSDAEISMPREVCYGLYCYLNSKQFSIMFSLINGTHTINISDFDNIKFPTLKELEVLGKTLLETKSYNKKVCSKILHSLLFV